MADEENILSDIDLENFNFDDVSFENGADHSSFEEAFATDEASIADEPFAVEEGLPEDPVAEENTSSFEEAFHSEESAVQESVTEDQTPTFEEAFHSEEPPVQESIAEDQTPTFEEAFATDEAPIEDEPFVSEESVQDSVVEEATAFEEPLATEDIPEIDETFVSTQVDVSEPVSEEEKPAFDEEAVLENRDSFSEYTPISAVESSKDIGYLQWYSGSSEDEMFEIDKNFVSGRFDAEGAKKTIHVNVGYDTYGWNVQFADGAFMSLHDVREYQLRHGKLPYSSGKIIYGKQFFDFSGIERIVVYESVKYFSYGV